jgi:hypothetical protein
MFNFRKCFAGLVGVSLFLCALATFLPRTGRGQGNNAGGPPQFGPRKFYLTQTQHNGSQASTACAEGYHMASLWEIFDTSNLRYNTELGTTYGDSGLGPPNGLGWIRTGSGPNVLPSAGLSNCNAWTSASPGDYGTFASPTIEWNSITVLRVSPWTALSHNCYEPISVWCVQD